MRHILANETYAGVWYAFRWQKVGKGKFKQRPRDEWRPVPVPSIVPHSLWEEVQEKLRSRHVGREGKGTYLLSSRIRCICGSSARGAHNKGGYVRQDGVRKSYTWYRCCSDERLKGFCGLPHFRAANVDRIVWSFAYDLIKNPEKLLKGYRDLQEQCSEEVDRLTDQIGALTQRIEEQKQELEDLQEQRKRTQSKTVRTMLDSQIETLGLAIDEMEERRTALETEQLSQPYTDAHIEEAIAEITKLREMYEALETINEESDFSAKRALINILNLKVTLYTKNTGERWIDIHWLRKVYPRPIDGEDNNSGTRHSQASMGAPTPPAGGW